MIDTDLERYANYAVSNRMKEVKQIKPESVVTAAWVRFKCQFGCQEHGSSYCCPPDTPTPEQTRAVLDCYERAMLFHIEVPDSKDKWTYCSNMFDMIVKLEGEMFKDGFYKALAFLAGPCPLCEKCGKLTGEPCRLNDRARPSMEGTGIDVYKTVRNNGFVLETLKEMTETMNLFCLMLVD